MKKFFVYDDEGRMFTVWARTHEITDRVLAFYDNDYTVVRVFNNRGGWASFELSK